MAFHFIGVVIKLKGGIRPAVKVRDLTELT
jgi:hypothetical protein